MKNIGLLEGIHKKDVGLREDIYRRMLVSERASIERCLPKRGYP